MKTFATGALASSLVLCAALVAPRGAAGGPDAAPAARTFKFTYTTTVPKPADGSKRLDVWVPLPLEDDGVQKVADLKVTATAGGKDVPVEQTKDDTYGNRMAHVGVDSPTSDVVVTWTATITRTEDRGQGKAAVLERYKQADKLIPIDGKAAELAKTIGTSDAAKPTRDRAKSIYDNVLDTMAYDKVAEGWGKGDFQRACDVGKGNCTDFHSKFMGIGRASGIPVRFTMGIPMKPTPTGEYDGYHCWAHFHDGTSWVPVDISEADKVVAKDKAKAEWFFGHLDPDRVSLTVGRDITLSPKQAGDPLLYFVYPYAEVDGKPYDVPKANRKFSWTS